MVDIDSNRYNCKDRYGALEIRRFVFLDRARQCSNLTIPTLIPPIGHNSTTRYYTPWQGIGARGVNNLSSKLLLALFPPNAPFFRMEIDDFTVAKLAQDPTARATVEEGLARIERAVTSNIEGTGMRAPIFLALKHAIVGGNVLIYLPKEGGARIYCLDSYVVVRDPKGNLLEVIIKEQVDEDTLSKSGLSNLLDTPEGKTFGQEEKDEAKGSNKNKPDDSDTIEVYTRFWRDEDKWRMIQEINGQDVPQSEGSWPIDKPPIIALRWSHVEGEDYGRSYVEEYLGDLISLEALSKAIVEAAASTSKTVWMVSPNGVTSAKDITEAESGDAIIGHKDDIHCLQSDKQADMKISYEAIKTITERLSFAFLLSSAVQRNGDRVTAEEIRYMASELEDALGGVYSVLAHEFQLPLVIRVMDIMQKAKKLPDLPDSIIKPTIITGLEALGRGHDLNRYQQFMQAIAGLGPQGLAYINMGDLIKRIGTALSIDMDGLVKSDADMQQAQAQQGQQGQQQQMMDIAGKAAPALVKAASDHAMATRGGMPPPSNGPAGPAGPPPQAGGPTGPAGPAMASARPKPQLPPPPPPSQGSGPPSMGGAPLPPPNAPH